MNDSSHPGNFAAVLAAQAPAHQMAGWPPQDPGPPGGMSGGGAPLGGGGFDPGGFDPYGADDGNFKKGRFNPVVILIGIALVIGGVILAVFAVKSSGDKMSIDDIARERKAIYPLPKAEQLPKWREWAKRDDVPALQQEAFAELAWAADEQGLDAIIAGLKSNDHRVRGTAAQAIAEYGSPKADKAKPALLEALKDADDSDKPQIVWALAVLKEASAFDTVMVEYRAGHLSTVQKLDQSPAFDPEMVAEMVPLDKLASMTGDESDSVRQLVATSLSKDGDPKWTSQLITLVGDSSIEVAREAAVGLGRIANEQALAPLVTALGKADKDSRQKFLAALRDGVGAKGLILALRTVSKDSHNAEKFQTRQIFDMLRELADPRGGDALYAYIQTDPAPHWRTEAALRMAEIGDVRAAETLGWRLKQDPAKLYDESKDPEWTRDDQERIVGARMLADLAALYPDKRPELLQHAEDGAIFWVNYYPQPHANGLRFLATARSERFKPMLKGWADPSVPLPKEGQQDMPPVWGTAQSALRYLGVMQDPATWSVLEKQIARKPAKLDISMASLNQGGLAVLGMTLKALGHGAAEGFAEWGDEKAYGALLKFVEDPDQNEQAKEKACFALAWVATDDQMKEIVSKVHSHDKSDPKDAIIRACFLETLVHRPVPDATAGLLPLMKPDLDMIVRHQVARAIGFGGLGKDVEPKLFAMLTDNALRADAALALMIGGDRDAAMRAVAAYNDAPPESMEELKEIYNRSFGYWSDKNYARGDVGRWIDNADGIARVKVRDSLQDWPKRILQRAIQGIEYDNGPHSLTRVRFRVMLYADAKSKDSAKSQAAIRILKFMGEKGVLMALRSEPGEIGERARKAFFEVMNPKAGTDALPDAPKASNDKNKGGGAGSVNVVSP